MIDIHRLLNHFGASPDFWPSLLHRARELELARPLFYALRYAKRMLGTSIPQETIEASKAGGPGKLILILMDHLFSRGLAPDHSSCVDRYTGIAKQLLYVRANWLRMPPFLLARHLFHKAFISPRTK